ncbi:YTH domain-containing protein ECT4 isoform X2 [Manihot esculenta]|uniref:YTH domain-containing family protein n=1 Tax=Manihot esculenta TaxID=3983 RepID=A0A2C9VRT8_MANES|nr:YTH domain-containing protein ECT4 isoform X2 [Manihot esculenta]
MATVAPSETAELLQNLSLDSRPKTLEIPEPTKKTSVYQYGSVESGVTANGQIQLSERSVTPFMPDLMDPSVCYIPNVYPSPAYYYGSYNGTGNEWDEYPRYTNSDGVEMASGVYGENGSVMYPNAYGYAPYGPYSPAASPVPTLGNDGQLYGPQHYQYPPYFQPLTASSGPFTPSQAASSQGELASSTVPDQNPLPAETTKGNSSTIGSGGVKGNNGATPVKPAYQNSLLNMNDSNGRGILPGGMPPSGYQDPRFGFDGKYRSTSITSSYTKGNHVPSSRNHFRQNSNYMGLHQTGPMSGMGTSHGFVNGMYPNKFYGPYGNTSRSGMGYGSTGYDSRINANGWLDADGKYKSRGRGNGYFGFHNESIDGLNELNRGPRAKGLKNQKGFGHVTLIVKGQNVLPGETVNEEKDVLPMIPDREQYNKADFPEDYTNAKFFVIKSYSEDDVHKSIKYNVWASTPNGNKKLDAAYQEAQQKPGGCPVYLFFSVNTSGQFVGLAEMVGPVDFHKNVEYWQQDKWTGCFPLKWHIVKDIPNSLLKHITLENNENKPVTNSRDTQEVKLEQGLKMIKIFKDNASKTCILDDFGFYEKRQKIIQEKKTKQQQFQKQVLDGKLEDEKKEMVNGLHKSLETVSDVAKEPTSTALSNGDVKHPENRSVAKTVDAMKASKPLASEKQNVANGVANGC